jgi:hypothetical protein
MKRKSKVVKKKNYETASQKVNGKTDRKISKCLFWTPRILAILFILFLMLFSLDVFGNGYNFWQTLLGLFMHNIPALLLLIVLIISWKKYEIVGGIFFILAGLLYIVSLLTSSGFEWYMLSWSLIIAGPAFLIGILFLIEWYRKRN